MKSDESKLKVVSEEEKSFAQGEIETIVLSPEQIEEIHVDEYSLQLFHATRVQPLTLLEIKRQFPEPKAKKAQSVMERFTSVGLVHLDENNRYFSNFPTKYVNYGKYKYDADIELKKDQKIFQEMKDNFGNSSHWTDRTYFSMDTFFTEEQSKELRELFMEIRKKSKEFAKENQEKGSLKGLKFRRLKFYDMISCLIVALMIGLLMPQASFARGGNDPHKVSFQVVGGNDPHKPKAWDGECLSEESAVLLDELIGGAGHDPKVQVKGGGGGHDPQHKTDFKGSYSELSCKADAIAGYVKMCEGKENTFCNDVRAQAKDLWMKIRGIWDI